MRATSAAESDQSSSPELRAGEVWARRRRQAGDPWPAAVRHPLAGHITLSSKQMAADNHTTIVGNLVDDPELRFSITVIAAGRAGPPA